MVGSDQGMYSIYSSVNTFWKDTTTMDNLRGADISASSVAGSTETIASNTKPNKHKMCAAAIRCTSTLMRLT